MNQLIISDYGTYLGKRSERVSVRYHLQGHIPISWGRFHALKSNGQVLPRNGQEPYRVTAEYNLAVGLRFD